MIQFSAKFPIFILPKWIQNFSENPKQRQFIDILSFKRTKITSLIMAHILEHVVKLERNGRLKLNLSSNSSDNVQVETQFIVIKILRFTAS